MKLVSEEMFISLSYYYAVEEEPTRFVICYLFDDDQGASLDFKALSADKYLVDDFIFMAI